MARGTGQSRPSTLESANQTSGNNKATRQEANKQRPKNDKYKHFRKRR